MLWLLRVWPFLIPTHKEIQQPSSTSRRIISVLSNGMPPAAPLDGEITFHGKVDDRGRDAAQCDCIIKQHATPGGTDNPGYVFHMIKPPNDWTIFLPTNSLRLLMEAMTRLQTATDELAVVTRRGAATLTKPFLSSRHHRRRARLRPQREIPGKLTHVRFY